MSDKDFEILQTVLSPEVSESEDQVFVVFLVSPADAKLLSISWLFILGLEDFAFFLFDIVNFPNHLPGFIVCIQLLLREW